MSELSEIKKSLDDLTKNVDGLTTIVNGHIVKTETYRVERDKVLDAHSNIIWDQGENKGLATKVDRLIQTEINRKWTIRAVVGALLAGLIDRLVHLIK